MIEVEEITKRFSHLYRCPDDITNIKIRVRLLDGETEQIKVFRWQEKIFSRFEREFYNDPKNCFTDLEKGYHDEVKNSVENNDVIFTYTSNDKYEDDEKFVFEDDRISESAGYDYERSLTSSITTPFLERDFEHMHIMADFGEFFEETWLKREYPLCRLRYSRKNKTLTVYPDFSKTIPHVLSVNTDNNRRIEYWLENASETVDAENNIMQAVALHEAKIRRENLAGKFDSSVQEGKLRAHVFLEILRGWGFEGGDVYVRFFVELPEGWHTDDALNGVTQASANQNSFVHFGFPFEFMLEHSSDNNAFTAPKIYFEVISKGSWSRFRSEGFAYKTIPIPHPGSHDFRLTCIRVGPNTPKANLRRFFIGDSYTCADPTWVGIPRNHEGKVINKYGVDSVCGGGELEVRMSLVLHRNSEGGKRVCDGISRVRFLMDRLDSNGLLQSVEKVVQAFQNARQTMLEARKKI